MNENAERINGWAAMIGVVAAMGSYAVSGQIIRRYLVMLVLSMTLMGAFVLMAVLTETDVDDDDDFGGGMMIPAHNPI